VLKKARKLTPCSYCKYGLDARFAATENFDFDVEKSTIGMFFISNTDFSENWV